LSPAQDADDGTNVAADDVSGFNVNTIAIEVPIELLTRDGKPAFARATSRPCSAPTRDRRAGR
jgi:hypothetical protein